MLEGRFLRLGMENSAFCQTIQMRCHECEDCNLLHLHCFPLVGHNTLLNVYDLFFAFVYFLIIRKVR